MSSQPVRPWVRVPSGNLHDWGVDYLRVTADSEAGKKAILLAWAKGRAQMERLGDRVRKGGMQGFTGESCGPLFYGRNDTHFMLQASGGKADELFPTLPWDSLHCTRIDVQITLQYDAYDPAIAQTIGTRRARGFLDHGRQPKPRQNLHIGYGRGDTLSIGSRSSPRYGRIYDKQQESKDERYARCWRFEVEYKDPVADKVVEFLRNSPSLDRAVAASVAGQMAEWGLALDLPVEPVLVAGSVGRREYDSDRAIKWLESQVRPTVERLLGTVDRASVLAALGLEEAGERPDWIIPRPAPPSPTPRDELRAEWSGDYAGLFDS